MRFIDLDLLLGREDTQPLIDAAELARMEIISAPNHKKRMELIDNYRDRWVAFRPHLEQIFGNKCWYTESRNPGTDDDIDHYRPKGELTDLPKGQPRHDGYWWEALSWRNFRLSCHRANRLRKNPETGRTHGKGARFPLIDEAERWRSPCHACCERPMLLDPTDPEDPPLLTFDPDGRVAISSVHQGDNVAVQRVEESRIYLHLDWPAFVAERRDMYATIYTKVIDGDRAYERFSRGEFGARDGLKIIARDLIRLTKEGAPYSRAAQAYVYRFRDRDWMQRFVLPYVPLAMSDANA